jgi:hypothetical protein
MAYEALMQRPDLHRVVLEEHSEGTYIFVFRKPGSSRPDEDHLQDDLEMAMRVCEEDYGVPRGSWKEIPCPGLM